MASGFFDLAVIEVLRGLKSPSWAKARRAAQI